MNPRRNYGFKDPVAWRIPCLAVGIFCALGQQWERSCLEADLRLCFCYLASLCSCLFSKSGSLGPQAILGASQYPPMIFFFLKQGSYLQLRMLTDIHFYYSFKWDWGGDKVDWLIVLVEVQLLRTKFTPGTFSRKGFNTRNSLTHNHWEGWRNRSRLSFIKQLPQFFTYFSSLKSISSTRM